MASKWREVTVENIASRIAMGPFGSDIKTDNFVPSGVPVIRGNNLTVGRFRADDFVFLTEEKADQLANANAYPGDLIFTHRGTLGQVGLIPDKPFKRYVVSQSQMKLTCDATVADPIFVYYFFKSPVGQHALLMNTSQTGVPAISRPVTSLKSVHLLLPPLSEQRAIAHILGSLDDKIELNRWMNRTLEKMAAAMFKSWFIDFDPVRAKAEGRDTGLPKEIADLFPDSFEDSDLGEIPKGWKVVSLPNAIEVNPTRSLSRGTAAPYVGMKEMPTTLSRPAGWRRRKFTSGSKFKNGDVLLARITPCLENGKTAFVDFLEGNEVGWGSTEYIILRSRPPLPAEFTYFLARFGRLREHAIANMTGTSGRQRVPATCFDKFPIVVPTEAVARVFERQAQSMLSKTRANDRQSRALEKLRDTLLPKLLSGELEVEPTADIPEEVAG